MFILATNDTMYNLTSPATLYLHVLLRKTYSIGAFALVGWIAARAALASGWRTSPLAIACWLAGFSLAIEIRQAVMPPDEGIAWHAFDVACGWFGGWLGALAARRRHFV
jgi:hypothetical protein